MGEKSKSKKEITMKIVEVTPTQLSAITSRLMPAQVIHADIPTPNLIIHHLNTMFVLAGEVQYGSIVGCDLTDVSISVGLPKMISEVVHPIFTHLA
jgi:hypothetical protein